MLDVSLSKSAKGDPNPLTDIDPGGPNPLADMDWRGAQFKGGPNPLGHGAVVDCHLLPYKGQPKIFGLEG